MARWIVGLAALMFTVTIGAIVALALAGKSVTAITDLAGPLLTAIVVTGVVGAQTKSHGDKLEQIERQTNGAMDKRIREQAARAIRDELGE